MTHFYKGEIVLLQNATYFEEWNGALAEVLEDLDLRNPMDMNSMQKTCIATYRVIPLVHGGFMVNCTTDQLRKIDTSDPQSERTTHIERNSDAICDA